MIDDDEDDLEKIVEQIAHPPSDSPKQRAAALKRHAKGRGAMTSSKWKWRQELWSYQGARGKLKRPK